MLQILIIGLVMMALLASFLTIITIGIANLSFAVLILWLLSFGGAWILIRRGYFFASLNAVALGLMFGLFLLYIPAGIKTSGMTYILSILPLILVGLLGTRRMLWFIFSCTVILFGVIGSMERYAPNLVGYAPTTMVFSIPTLISFAIVVFLPALSIDQFSTMLQNALTAGLQRQEELEDIRAQQDTVITERTKHLTQALSDVQQREEQLNQTVTALRTAQVMIRAMSVPVLPILPHVLTVPLIGEIDQERADILMNNTLHAVTQEHARVVIFDITAVPLVDTHVARALIQTANAIKLMGAKVLLVGIQPEVAQTIISLDLDLSIFGTYADLRTAIAVVQSSS